MFGSSPSRGPLQAGDPAPALTAVSDTGDRVDLAAVYGRQEWTLVYFYPKDNTGGCTKEGIAFGELHGQFAAAGCLVIGVSPDSLANRIQDCDSTLLITADEGRRGGRGSWCDGFSRPCCRRAPHETHEP